MNLTAFGSQKVILSRMLRTTSGVQMGCMHIQANGKIALHQATGPQLLLVVQGTGWVRGNSAEKTTISAGQAVFWEDGEWHETGSDDGLTAIVVECAELEPGRFMPPVD